MVSKFYYFGFGSNMLAKRLHIQNPSAVRVGPGKLENFRLDFHTKSKGWLGAPATIVPKDGDCVWGSIWQIDSRHMTSLDDQEGVHHGMYTPITVSVYCSTLNCLIECRAYHLCHQPATDLKALPVAEIPFDRQPSMSYLKTLVKGAIETGVPSEYVEWLRRIKHNSEIAHCFEKQLELENVILSQL